MHVVSVYPKSQYPDSTAAGILSDVSEFLHIDTVERLHAVKKYYLEGVSEEEAKKLAEVLLGESLWQDVVVNEDLFNDADHVREIAYQPGMMNPEVASIMKAAHDLGVDSLKAADTAMRYCFYGKNLSEEHVDTITEKLLYNSTVQDVRTEKPKTLIIKGKTDPIGTVEIRNASDDELMALSKDKLFLNLEEMKIIKDYYNKIGREPIDAELETLAQTWSEHCGHKTFKAKLTIDGKEREPLYTRLKNATKEINSPAVWSAFVDNSGVLALNDEWGICGKVETHNSPSAIEPYGGAATGSGGVFRDIAGTGRGAKVIASVDIFCVGPPDITDIPKGCLHPRYILKNIVRGVRDYGNRMGIPTNNGSVHFHEDYRAKPTVIVGSYGLIRKEDAKKREPEPGDLVVTIGGATGRDGIHGATFSSGEMSDTTDKLHSSAVQIGNAIEEKRAFDAIAEMTEKGYIQAITDCGAGGYSSAVGEMGENVGVRVQLEEIPMKYTGLAPWEMWISESQERMVLAVKEAHIDEVMEISKKYNAPAHVIGMFTGDKKLHVTYKGEDVVNLDMEFVHDGLPQRHMEGTVVRPPENIPEVDEPTDYNMALAEVMGHLNVSSKEPIYRQYDHNVQGTSVLPQYCGKTFKSPTDAAIMEPILDSNEGVAIAHGLNPILNRVDPYQGSLWAVCEAVANMVATGVNPDKIALIDNFIWPFPEAEELGALSESIDACVDASLAFQMPFISGKDSLSSTYRSKTDDTVIKIPPTLCISAFAPVEDVQKTCSSCFKKAGNNIVIVGQTTDEMGRSAYYDTKGEEGTNIPQTNLEKVRAVFYAVYHGINQGIIKTAHDISEGGLGAAVTEMCLGEKKGAHINLDEVPFEGEMRPDYALFNEAPGRFVLEIAEDDMEKATELFADIPWAAIGKVTDDFEVRADHDGNTILTASAAEMQSAWEAPMLSVFGSF